MSFIKLMGFFLLLFTLQACSEEDPIEPSCLEKKIDEFKSDQATCENASIKKYNFQNQEVYAFTQGICISDGGTDVILEDCTQVCFLGGIAGFQDCNGDLFFDVAQEIETVWEAN